MYIPKSVNVSEEEVAFQALEAAQDYAVKYWGEETEWVEVDELPAGFDLLDNDE